MLKCLKARAIVAGTVSVLALVSCVQSVAAAEPAGSQGHDWRGFYVGFGGGFGAVIHDVELDTLFGSGRLDGLGGAGVFGEVTAGYDFMLTDRLLLGGVLHARRGNIGPRISVSAGIIDDFLFDQRLDLHLANTYGFDVAARLGYLVAPNTLAYVLGGYSWQRFELKLGGDLGGDLGCACSLQEERGGYVVGLGAETAVGGGWTVSSEYRYSAYREASVVLLDAFAVSVAPSTHTFHVGANYRFNAGSGGGASFQAPAYDWTGAYVGGALGFGAVVHDLGVDEGIEGTGSFHGIGGDGVFGEAVVGYDHDFGGFVGGVMIDANVSGVGTTLTTSLPGFGASVDSRYGVNLLARLGAKLNDTTLAYGVGGYSWQRFEASMGDGLPGGGTMGWDTSGYSIGGGIETAVARNTTIGVEYRYSRFGAEDFGTDGLLTVVPTLHTVRFGAKFKFN